MSALATTSLPRPHRLANRYVGVGGELLRGARALVRHELEPSFRRRRRRREDHGGSVAVAFDGGREQEVATSVAAAHGEGWVSPPPN